MADSPKKPSIFMIHQPRVQSLASATRSPHTPPQCLYLGEHNVRVPYKQLPETRPGRNILYITAPAVVSLILLFNFFRAPDKRRNIKLWKLALLSMGKGAPAAPAPNVATCCGWSSTQPRSEDGSW